MAFGWFKVLSIAHSLYTHRHKVTPLLDRVQRARVGRNNDDGLNELTTAVRQLAADHTQTRKVLRTVFAISIASLVVSVVTLGIVVVRVI